MTNEPKLMVGLVVGGDIEYFELKHDDSGSWVVCVGGSKVGILSPAGVAGLSAFLESVSQIGGDPDEEK